MANSGGLPVRGIPDSLIGAGSRSLAVSCPLDDLEATASYYYRLRLLSFPPTIGLFRRPVESTGEDVRCHKNISPR